jgi:hypothetical protein
VRGNGQNQKHTTVETTLKVAEEHEPGDDLCIAIHDYDSNGNLTTINNPMPSKVFKIVDEGKKDDTVTEFLGWGD